MARRAVLIDNVPVEPLVDILLEQVDLDRHPRVLDPVCGDGTALAAVAQRLLAIEAEDFDPDALVAVDFRPDAGARRLVDWAARHGFEAPKVHVGDVLGPIFEPEQQTLLGGNDLGEVRRILSTGTFDVVICNVPTIELDNATRERLRPFYRASHGRFTAEVPIVERALEIARRRGAIVCLRFRKAMLRRAFGLRLVEDVLGRCQVLGSHEDGDHVGFVLRSDTGGDSAFLFRTLGSLQQAGVLEQMSAGKPLGAFLASPVASTSHPGCDDVWSADRLLGVDVPTAPWIRSAQLSDWGLTDPQSRIIWPYDDRGEPLEEMPTWVPDVLGRDERLLRARTTFGRSLQDLGVRWWEYSEHHSERWEASPKLAVALAAKDPQVVRLRSPAVVSSGAAAIALTQPDDLDLVQGCLSSSVGCFWSKQMLHVYSSTTRSAFRITAEQLAEFPLPDQSRELIAQCAGRLDMLARSLHEPAISFQAPGERIAESLEQARRANERIRRQMVWWQEALDLVCYGAYGLCDELDGLPTAGELAPESRAFQCDECPGDELSARLWGLIADNDRVRAVETAEFKRTWAEADWDAQVNASGRRWLVTSWLDEQFRSGRLPTDRPVPQVDIDALLSADERARVVASLLDEPLARVLLDFSVPLEATRVYSPRGLQKVKARGGRSAGGSSRSSSFSPHDYARLATTIPKRSASDHQRQVWNLRGRYDVPREHLLHLSELSEISGRALFGWAGASEFDRRALEERSAADLQEGQLDLERLLRVRVLLNETGAMELADLARLLWAEGWSYRDVRLAMSVLEQSGAVSVDEAGRWSLVEA